MRIRQPFAIAFLFLVAIAGYAGLSSSQIDTYIDDKVLHFLTFFILTTCFYWILDTSRRRTLHFTLIVCTGILGIGSEFLQGFLPNGREFDPYDILANIVGSTIGVALCTWYHLRMLERKRLAKNYQAVPADDDLELGGGAGSQESGEIATSQRLEHEVDNWDENVEDAWDAEDHTATESVEDDGPKTPSASSSGEVDAEPKKRTD